MCVKRNKAFLLPLQYSGIQIQLESDLSIVKVGSLIMVKELLDQAGI